MREKARGKRKNKDMQNIKNTVQKREKIIQKSSKFFTEEEKHKIIKELLKTGVTKSEIWEKYTGQQEEHGQLIRWMRKLGYSTKEKTRRPNRTQESIDIINVVHEQREKQRISDLEKRLQEAELFESLQCNKRIVALEKQLQEAEMKAIAFSTMIDIAEKEFAIPIRKKFNTKP